MFGSFLLFFFWLILRGRLIFLVIVSIELRDCDVGKDRVLHLYGLDPGEKKVVVVVGGERNTGFGYDT